MIKPGDVLRLKESNETVIVGESIGVIYSRTIVCLKVEFPHMTFITEYGTLRTRMIENVMVAYRLEKDDQAA